MSNNEASRLTGEGKASGLPTTIPLGPTSAIDLSWIPDDERRVLLNDYAKGVLNLAQRANELGVEVSVLRNTLDTLAGTTQKVSEAGDAVTITHVQNSQFGRTEVIMGNTDTAAKGKLSRTQSGEFNWLPIYIIGGVIAAIVLVSILIRH